MESTTFPQCEQSYNLPHYFLVFIFKPSILFGKKSRLWQLNNPPFPFYSTSWVLSHCSAPLCDIQSSLLSGVLIEFCLGFFVYFCFVLQREDWEYWNIPWRKKRVIIQSDLMNEFNKKKVDDLKWHKRNDLALKNRIISVRCLSL